MYRRESGRGLGQVVRVCCAGRVGSGWPREWHRARGDSEHRHRRTAHAAQRAAAVQPNWRGRLTAPRRRGGAASAGLGGAAPNNSPSRPRRTHQLEEDEPLGRRLLLELVAAPLGQELLGLCWWWAVDGQGRGGGVSVDGGQRLVWHLGGRRRPPSECRQGGSCRLPAARLAPQRALHPRARSRWVATYPFCQLARQRWQEGGCNGEKNAAEKCTCGGTHTNAAKALGPIALSLVCAASTNPLQPPCIAHPPCPAASPPWQAADQASLPDLPLARGSPAVVRPEDGTKSFLASDLLSTLPVASSATGGFSSPVILEG